MKTTETTAITPFLFNENLVRTVIHEGAPWFIAADACAILGLENTTRALDSLEDSDLTLLKVRAGLQTREMNAVNEPGLYRLIFKSRKAEARAFQRWVFHEVLPTIRRTGSYTPSHQNFLALVRDQLSLGVSPDVAAKTALRLSLPEPGTQVLPMPVRAFPDFTVHILEAMEPGHQYTIPELANLLPDGHPLHHATPSSQRSAIGKAMERARQRLLVALAPNSTRTKRYQINRAS